MAKLANDTTNTTSNTSKPKAKVWLNVGVMQDKTTDEGQFLLSPFGIPVDTLDTKRMSKLEKQLHEAVLRKAEELGEGSHDIKLVVKLNVSGEEPKKLEEVDFNL